MRLLRTALIAMLALAATACFGLDNLFNNSPTNPSNSSSSSSRSYLGTWTGPAAAAPGTQTCGNVQWKITSQTATQISGDFTAKCTGSIDLAGTVVGTISDSATIPWAASGNATQGTTNCAFNLAGTGTFQGTSSIVVSYSGTACGVAVSGADTITRS